MTVPAGYLVSRFSQQFDTARLQDKGIHLTIQQDYYSINSGLATPEPLRMLRSNIAFNTAPMVALQVRAEC